MRVVFMGTPDFAVPSLLALADRHEVAAVYTRPDAPSARGSALRPSPVKTAALELGLPVRQPVTLRDPAEVDALAALAPDVACVAAYGLILPPEILAVPRLGCVNVHASLLPRHRGAAPIQRAILAGDERTGVSIMLMDEGLDTGPIALQTTHEIDRADNASLTRTLAEQGAAALVEVLGRMEDGTAVWTPQDEGGATYAAKVTRADVTLSPELTAEDADRRIRASSPSARSALLIEGRLVVVLAAEPADTPAAPGDARLAPSGLVLGFADGSLVLRRLRPEGRREMDGDAFARGARLGGASTWTAAP